MFSRRTDLQISNQDPAPWVHAAEVLSPCPPCLCLDLVLDRLDLALDLDLERLDLDLECLAPRLDLELCPAQAREPIQSLLGTAAKEALVLDLALDLALAEALALVRQTRRVWRHCRSP